MEYVIIIAVVAFILLGLYFFRKYMNREVKQDFFNDGVHLSLKHKFLLPEELEFQQFMQAHLPKSMVIFPKVCLESITTPFGNRNQYNAIISKYLDFVIFQVSDMRPIIAVDLVHNASTNTNIEKYDKNVLAALKGIHLPVMKIMVQDFYIYDEIKEEMKKCVSVLPKEDEDKI